MHVFLLRSSCVYAFTFVISMVNLDMIWVLLVISMILVCIFASIFMRWNVLRPRNIYADI